MSLAGLADRPGTHLEWRLALRGGRRQALLMRIAGRKVRALLKANFDALIAS